MSDLPHVEVYERVAKMEAEVSNLKDQSDEILIQLKELSKELRDFKDKIFPVTELKTRVDSLEARLNEFQRYRDEAKGGWKIISFSVTVGMGLLAILDHVYNTFFNK